MVSDLEKCDLVGRWREDRFLKLLGVARKPHQASGASSRLQRLVTESERKVGRLTEAIGKMGYSAALAASLTSEEKRLAELRAKAALIAAPVQEVLAELPPVAMIEAYVRELVEMLQARPEEAKALLKTHLGEIRMDPKRESPDRHYLATGAFQLSVPIPARPGRGLENQVAGAGFEPATFGL